VYPVFILLLLRFIYATNKPTSRNGTEKIKSQEPHIIRYFGIPAISLRPWAFRPTLADGLVLSAIQLSIYYFGYVYRISKFKQKSNKTTIIVA